MRHRGWMFAYPLLLAGAMIMVFPFVWMVLTSLKPLREIYSLSWWPQNPTLGNYRAILQEYPFARWFLNSVLVAVTTTTSMVLLSSVTGYTLAKLDFPGKKLLFFVILATMFIPTELLVIPWYAMSVRYRWVDTYWGILFPGLIHAFGVFLMRQFFLSVPNELLDAGRIDGLSEFGVFARVALPLMKPALGALAILNFVGNWNAFLWPLVVTSRRDLFTLPVGLALFSGEAGVQWNLITAGTVLTALPTVVIFLLFQRAIIESISTSGLKG
ncbi:MAG: carbohydrate ABC transporter permease [Candidatus Bipolaricaulaceae bacterium]